jgi:hypothetical protein
MRVLFVSLLMAVAAVAGCARPMKNNLPPAQMIMEPGPGVGGPGPGVLMYQPGAPCTGQTSQIAFMGPEGGQVTWDIGAVGSFDSQPLVLPGRYNFPQCAIYRLKLSNIAGRPGVELYPTLEVGPALPRSEAFLAHNAIPVQFTEEDLDQVLSGNFVTKVIYLPDPEFQELALAGVETLVSTRLDPGVDPIVEADRRGAILAIVRIGNKDLQVPGGPVAEDGVMQASYRQSAGGPCPCPTGGGPMGVCPVGGGFAGNGAMPPTYIAGITAPQYGMPMCGTPIGLPGPPHVPLGIPAGLQRHTIQNHTKVHIPIPTERVKIDVKQKPGMSYPEPVNHVRIVEKTNPGAGVFHQPLLDRHECVKEAAPCPPAGPCEMDP